MVNGFSIRRQKKFILYAFFFLLLCACRKEKEEYPLLAVGEPVGTTLYAVGVEFDPHFFAQNVTRNARTQDWKTVRRRVREMQVRHFRVMVLPEWFEPENDNDDPAVTDWSQLTFGSPEMESLYRVLDLAQENDIGVTLVLWGCAANMRLLSEAYAGRRIHFLAEGNSGSNWVVAPKNADEWCENFSILVQYLLREKNYTCIREITPVNEPSWSYIIDDGVSVDAYLTMCRKLDERFRKDRIRDRVAFNLSDDAEHTEFLRICTEQLAGVADRFNSHTYKFGYTTPNSEIETWERTNRNLAAKAGKPHLIGEFGSNQTIGSTRQADIDRYERGVLLVRIALNLFNAGAAGVSYWSLYDQYYNRDASYGEMQQTGLWRYKKEDYAPEPNFDRIRSDYEIRPHYHAYSLLTRFVRPHSEIRPIGTDDEFFAATAFRQNDGRWVYCFANASENDKKQAIVNDDRASSGRYEVYRYEENRLPEDERPIPVSETIRAGKTLKISVPARSVAVYRQQ